MAYLHNPYQGIERQKKLYDFEESRSLNENLKKSFEKIGKNISDSISASTREIVGVLDDNFDTLTNTLNAGFSDVSHKLSNVNYSIQNLAVMFDWRLSEMINQQKVSNILLGNIVLLLRVPDFQKERQYYIEQGFKHYKNASIDEDLYEDALKNLLEAEKREVTDYIVLYQIGMIYLHSTKEEIKDFAKAEDYFRRAAKYSIVESNPEAQKSLNILVGEKNQSISTAEAAKTFAANSYFSAGIACYFQNKFLPAVELSEKAYSLLPSLLEAGFLQAKSLALLNKPEESVRILQSIIQAQPIIYILKIASDPDLEPKNEIRSMLKELRDEAVNKVSERLSKIKAENINVRQFRIVLSEIEELIKKNTFLDALNAHNEIEKKREWRIGAFDKILYEKFLHNNPNFGKTDSQNFFEICQEYGFKWENPYLSNIEDFIDVLNNLAVSLQDKIDGRNILAAIMQRQTQADKELIRRIEEDRKQYNEIISQAKNVEEKNIHLALSLYEKAAKLGSSEAGKRLQELKTKTKNQRIKELLQKAQSEEEAQNRKWLFKNHDLAIYYYEEAAKLGSNEAKQRLQQLRKS